MAALPQELTRIHPRPRKHGGPETLPQSRYDLVAPMRARTLRANQRLSKAIRQLRGNVARQHGQFVVTARQCERIRGAISDFNGRNYCRARTTGGKRFENGQQQQRDLRHEARRRQAQKRP